MDEEDEEFYDAEDVHLLVDRNVNITLPSDDSEPSSNVNETNVCVYCF